MDESGDPGLKLDSGSSKYFVVTLVVFEENEEAEALDRRVNLLKHELGLNPFYEMKFNKCNKEIRERFLFSVIAYNFFYFAIVINKEKLYGEGFGYKESFYKYASGLVFQNAKTHLHDATIIIDGSGSKDFRNELSSYLRKKISGGYIKKIKLQDSRRNNLLQLADMVSGAVKRSFSEKSDSKVYRDIIKCREIYMQVWPRK